jgi:hypothetical protein
MGEEKNTEVESGATGPEEERFDEELRFSQEREDRRWNATNQFNDWMLLIAIAIFQATWMVIVILLEPGIR